MVSVSLVLVVNGPSSRSLRRASPILVRLALNGLLRFLPSERQNRWDRLLPSGANGTELSRWASGPARLRCPKSRLDALNGACI
ncbi:hypothetical protein FA13DRAFT_1446196 [Coprinellus micaceus]|uniref:Uncharacterized protein n=1 Tax=Coprinellus micaceus TaxID=71717 RepID=A0A4Y7TLW1_COPMI|nr:hypothetical protein FA13DRAFT_1446196 [Coprinellus micaceus]